MGGLGTSFLLEDPSDSGLELEFSRVVDPRVVEGWPSRQVPSRLPLLQPRDLSLASDHPSADTVCPSPVGGRPSQFLSAWREITLVAFCFVNNLPRVQISLSNFFPGLLREITVVPRDVKALHSIQAVSHDLFSKIIK